MHRCSSPEVVRLKQTIWCSSCVAHVLSCVEYVRPIVMLPALSWGLVVYSWIHSFFQWKNWFLANKESFFANTLQSASTRGMSKLRRFTVLSKKSSANPQIPHELFCADGCRPAALMVIVFLMTLFKAPRTRAVKKSRGEILILYLKYRFHSLVKNLIY